MFNINNYAVFVASQVFRKLQAYEDHAVGSENPLVTHVRLKTTVCRGQCSLLMSTTGHARCSQHMHADQLLVATKTWCHQLGWLSIPRYLPQLCSSTTNCNITCDHVSQCVKQCMEHSRQCVHQGFNRSNHHTICVSAAVAASHTLNRAYICVSPADGWHCCRWCSGTVYWFKNWSVREWSLKFAHWVQAIASTTGTSLYSLLTPA